MFVRREIVTFLFFENPLIEISHALFLSADVESAIATDGEEPFRGSMIELLAFASLQLNKGFLHDILCPITIAENARGVLQEGQLETAEQRRQVIIGWDWFGHTHKLFPSSNPQPANLLNRIIPP